MEEARTATGASYNRGIRCVAATLGVLVGLGSINHGLLECLQGNRATPGRLIYALGPGYGWTVWKEGGEGAFTLIPNYLATGVVATLLGVVLIAWSLWGLQRRRGPAVFLLLGVASLLTGGGVAQAVPIVLNWAAATRIRGSLGFWRKLLPARTRRALSGWWRWCAGAATVLTLVALEIAVLGYVPGLTEPAALMRLSWALAGLALGLFVTAFVAAFAEDIDALD